MTLPDSAKELIRSGALGHLVTIGTTGAPHVTCVWVAVDGEQLAVLRARMELAGGTLSATAAELHAVIPLSPGRELAAVTDT